MLAEIVKAHVAELEVQVPEVAVAPEIVQPVKVESVEAVRVSVTEAPDVYGEEQIGLSAPPQLLILGVASPDETDPLPVEALSITTLRPTPE